MRDTIFLSGEIDVLADKNLSKLFLQFDNKIKNIKISYYGDEINEIGIICICDRPEWEKGVKERRLIKHKTKEADIRLKIHFLKFMNGNEKQQYLMYCKNIIDSLKVIRDRCKEDFRGQDLINDVMQALEITNEDLIEIEKYIAQE